MKPAVAAAACLASAAAGVAIGLRLQGAAPSLSPEVVLAAARGPAIPVREERAGGRRDIVLVTVDTLRADVLGAYGDRRGLSPWVDALAARGVLFERAHASSSWTVPTVATLMTGLFAHQHGVDRGAFRKGKVLEQQPLAGSFDVLAERLQQQGYRTFGVTTNAHLAPELGYEQGFLSYQNLGFQDASVVHARVEELVAEMAQGDAPVFLWVHLFDPHDPYRLREPWFSELQAQSLQAHDLVEPQKDRQARAKRWGKMRGKQLRAHRAELDDPINAATIKDLYAAEVRYTDEWISRILATFGEGPDPIVVFTADHGEELLDHGSTGHRQSLHDELVRMPLIIAAPGLAPEGIRVPAPISLVDLLPTLVELAGASPETAAAGTSGQSLIPLWQDQTRPDAPVIFSVKHSDHEQHAIVDGPWKLIQSSKVGTPQLFNTQADPGERIDLSSNEPARVSALSARLDAALAAGRRAEAGPSVPVGDAQTLEMLEAMGYVDEDDH
jgi:arylsulfatase A-like enzyme